jgi:hypothetical protein
LKKLAAGRFNAWQPINTTGRQRWPLATLPAALRRDKQATSRLGNVLQDGLRRDQYAVAGNPAQARFNPG